MRAGWLNLSLRTDRAMLVRSVLEGVAYNARWLFDAYEKFLRRPVPKVRLLGGARRATSGAKSTPTSSGDLWSRSTNPATRSFAASRCGRASASAS